VAESLRQGLGWAWRGAATGFCFFIFGLGELIEAFFIFPLILLLLRHEARRKVVGKWVMYASFKGFVELMRLTGVLRYEVKNLERLDRPGLLILSNHPTLIDVVFLISFLRRADCIVKDSLIKNPFTRYAILAAGLTSNSSADGSPQALLDACAKSMDEGNALVIFPEGSRSEAGALLPFQRGAANIAVRARRDITPVLIHVSEHNLGRSSTWWRAPARRMDFRFEVMEDIAIQPLIEANPEAPAAARVLTQQLSLYFQKELDSHGHSRRS
jgi:1-acyl-sn-glycerol-3-phosphate acyltransferase